MENRGLYTILMGSIAFLWLFCFTFCIWFSILMSAAVAAATYVCNSIE